MRNINDLQNELEQLEAEHESLLDELNEYEDDNDSNPDGYELEDRIALIEVLIFELEHEIENSE
jgi:hypothetical protein